jgi:hypothetical protein
MESHARMVAVMALANLPSLRDAQRQSESHERLQRRFHPIAAPPGLTGVSGTPGEAQLDAAPLQRFTSAPGHSMSVGLRHRRIDLMRGIAIVLVLFQHFNIAYHLDDTLLAGAFGWNAVRAVARNGNYGVTTFFVISGYLITSNTERRSDLSRQR